MTEWRFLTNHARALVCIARDPGMRLKDIAASIGVTERSAFAIVGDLIKGGYVAKEKDGRRNRYDIHIDAPLGEALGRQRKIGEFLALLVDSQPLEDAPERSA